MKQDPTAYSERSHENRSPLADAMRIGAPVAILVLGILAYIALRGLKELPTKSVEQATAPFVDTVVVETHGGGLDIAIDGVVVPFREIDLSAEVSGRIAKKAEICRAGNYVTRGTPLIQIDARDYQLEVNRLKRELAQADVSLKELEVEITNTKSLVKLERERLALQRKDLERQQTLADKKIVTDSDLDRAKREELTAVNAVMMLDNQLLLFNTRRSRLESARDLCRSELEKADLDLTRTRVSSPIDGVIIKEMVEEDSYVQKGTSLAKLEDTSAVEVKCNLKMDELYWLWSQGETPMEQAPEGPPRDYQVPRAPVTVTYELAGRRYVWKGVLSRFDGIGVDERTRTVPCRVLVADPRNVHVDGQDAATSPVGPPALVRGMFVTVNVHTRPGTTLLKVPQRAVQPGNMVWVVEDGKLSIRRVRVADSSDDAVLLYADSAGLLPGMKLVGSPLTTVSDGMTVRERAAE